MDTVWIDTAPVQRLVAKLLATLHCAAFPASSSKIFCGLLFRPAVPDLTALLYIHLREALNSPEEGMASPRIRRFYSRSHRGHCAMCT